MPENHTNTVCQDREQPGLTTRMRLWKAARKRRRAAILGPGLIITLLLALAIFGVIAGNNAGWFSSVSSSGDDTAAKNSVDRVGQSFDKYWAEFAQDRHGRRDIDLSEVCNFVNAEFATGQALVLRTLAVRDSGDLTAVTTASDTAEAADSVDDGEADYIALRTGLGTAVTAGCPTITGTGSTTVGHPLAGVDMIVSDNTIAAANLPAGFAAAQQIQADDLAEAGLMSTNTVWMAQHVGMTVPAGSRSNGNTSNEVLVIGAVSPSGRSFCLIKVFNASNRGEIGEYRVSRDASATDETPFAVCSEGTDTTGVRINSGWPAAS